MQGETPAQTVSSLGQALRAVGGLTKPSGRGLFMFQCLLAGSSTAAIIGLFGATVLGYAFTAGAVGFLGGSCVGFLLGSIGYYRTCCRQSLIALIRYPEVMRHHIDIDFGMHGVEKASRFRGASVQETVQEVRSDVALQGMLVAAWHSAVPAIEVGLYSQSWTRRGLTRFTVYGIRIFRTKRRLGWYLIRRANHARHKINRVGRDAMNK